VALNLELLLGPVGRRMATAWRWTGCAARFDRRHGVARQGGWCEVIRCKPRCTTRSLGLVRVERTRL